MAGNILELTADNWQKEVVHGDSPVVVEFWAPGCGPCMKLSAVLDKLAEQFAGRAKFGKVDVSAEMDLSSQYGIWGVPVVLIFNRNTKPVYERKGFVPESDLAKAVDDVLAN